MICTHKKAETRGIAGSKRLALPDGLRCAGQSICTLRAIPMQGSLRRVRWAVLSAATLLILIVMALATTLLYRDHAEALERARTLVTRVAQNSEADINRNLVSVDMMLAELSIWITQERTETPPPSRGVQTLGVEKNLSRLVRAALQQNLMLRDIAVIASDGSALIGARPSTQRLGLPMPAGFLDAVLQQPYAGLMVSAPTLNPLNSERVLYLARSQRLPDGMVVAVVAELQLSLLSALLNPEDDSQRLTVTLEKESGQLLVSYPMVDVLIGQTLHPALESLKGGAGAQDMPGRLQAEPSVTAVHPTLYAGLLLSVGMPLRSALAQWQSQRNIVLGGTAVLLFLILGGSWATWRGFSRMAAARAEVALANTRLQDANQQLAGSLSLVEATLEATGEAVLVIGNDGRIQHYNALLAVALRMPEAVLTSGDMAQLRNLLLDQLQNPAEYLDGNARAYASPTAEVRDQLVFKDGRVFQRHSLPQLLDGQVMGRVWSFQDVTAFKEAERKLQLAASVFSHAHEGISITDAAGNIVDVNDTFIRITGYEREEVVGKNPRILQSGRQSPEYYAAMWRELLEQGRWSGEVWNRRKSGEVYAEQLSISAVRDVDGKVQHYVSLFTDISSIKQHEQQLEHIAHFDALTNLPNRVLLADRLHQGMAQTQRRGQYLAVVYLDLDGFKAVNDQYGHAVGDEFLVALARSMNAALRDGDTLARIGGDEFVAVLVGLPQAHDCEPVLARLLQAAADPVALGELLLRISASIGVTIFPQDGADADLLLRHADQAMYVAKQNGKNRYHLFDLEQDAAVQSQRESLAHVRHALENRQFVLHFQPKVNLQTGEVTGAEALIRWQHPERGLLAPGLFLPVIEDHPISIELGEWVIATALSQMSAWQSIGLHLPVSVNISAHQLQQGNFDQRLKTLLDCQPDVNASSLELEILETSALEDIAQVSEAMHACRALGVHFALDDFGTGYSSLTYLRRLPAEVIKIDQSFVRDMLDSPDDLSIIKGVIGLAAAFRRDIIAEGVETKAHGTLLLSMGCIKVQGFGIARPMPAAALPDWAANWHVTKGWAS